MPPTKRKYKDPECIANGEEGPKVWSLGILNEKGQYNDKIQVPSQTRLLELVTLLCNVPVKERREQHDDHAIDAHLWDLKIIPTESSSEKKLQICRPPSGMYFSDDDDDDTTTVDPSHLVSNLQSLELGGTLCFKYDYGSPTIVMLKVLSISYPRSEQGEQKLEFHCSMKTTEIVNTTPKETKGEDVVSDESHKKPLNPRHSEPPMFSEKDDAVIISQAKDSVPVTFLALAPEASSSSPSPSLYSGHKNGEVCKWNLETNKQIWKQQVFRNSDGLLDNVKGLIGIRGIMVREASSGEHLVYVWAHNFDSEERDQPNEIKVLNGNRGDENHTLVCEVDEDMAVHPIISCVVYCELLYDNVWNDCIIVGLNATCACLTYNETYTDYNIEEAEDFAYGNILPFVGEEMEETWRGHKGSIRSMAVTTDGYVLSCSEHPRKYFAEAMILWASNAPGVPLHRIDLYMGGSNLAKAMFSPLRILQGGIAVHGNKILIGGQYGDLIVPIDIDGTDEKEDGKEDKQPSLVMRGYGKLGLRYHIDDSFKGCLVGSGNAAITSNEGCEELYIFPLDSLGDNPDIVTDTRARTFEEWDKHVDEFDETILRARSMALGQIKFRFQKDASSKKENSSNKGGPVAVAMKGRYVVAGFDNGSILKAKLLPEKFEDGTNGSSNLHASSFLHVDNCDSPHFDELDHPPDELDHPPELPQNCIIQ